MRERERERERESNNLFHVRKYVQNDIENVIFIVIKQIKSDIKVKSSGEVKR